MNLPIYYDISKTQKFNMNYNFQSRIPLADAHSKHILIILVIDSRNFRKLHMNGFLNLNEMRTQKIKYATDKKVEFHRMSILNVIKERIDFK